MRGAVYARSTDFYMRYIDTMYMAMREQALNMDEDDLITSVLDAAGLPVAQIIVGMSDPDVKQTLVASTESSVARGAFGSPTFLSAKRFSSARTSSGMRWKPQARRPFVDALVFSPVFQ
jgi:2-hydroxychromene-2-carboxylate isomerase